MTVWRCRDFELPVFERTHILGVLNVTPDSFSDGGRYIDRDAAIKRAIEMAEEGADIIDVGGESTRPGAEPVPADVEIERVIPVIEAVASEVGIPISIDTTKSEVAEAAMAAGASIINDVSAFRFDPPIAEVAVANQAGVILMHMRGEPRTMQDDPTYGDVVIEVKRELEVYAHHAEAMGISAESIAVDPGIGFGKTREHNLAILQALGTEEWPVDIWPPIVVGPSRKSFIGLTLQLPVEERMEGTAAVVAWLAARRVPVVRVHDPKEMARIVRMTEQIRDASPTFRGLGAQGGKS